MRVWDEASKPPRRSPIQAKKIERHYAAQLRKIARHIAEIVRGMAPDGEVTPQADQQISDALTRYAQVLEPWANAAAGRMLADVDRQDAKDWMRHSQSIGRALQNELANAPTGRALQARLREQVSLIKSLPTDAAARVHELALKGLVEGRRSSEIAAEIMRTGEVTQSRANTIARTEVSRTASILTQVRAESIGSTAYVWRTSKDAQVRPSHKAMNGQVVDWTRPPTLDGMTGHAGTLVNCRCWPEPILPD